VHVLLVTANANEAAGALPDSLQLAIGFKKAPGQPGNHFADPKNPLQYRDTAGSTKETLHASADN